MVKEGMTELEKVRAQAKAYVQSFGVDVVIIRTVPISFIQFGMVPEGIEEMEIITRYNTG